ncbi:MAG TPA: hypothetical protein P5511_05640 [Candidatus Goldiibacteriota bacterium]|nr:hypothetical protein [Candidatus Goldiibacteriota bacterium]
MKKHAMAVIAAIILMFPACAEKQTLEQRLASPDAAVALQALDDLWRLGDNGANFLAAVNLLDKQETAERAAIALSRTGNETVDNIVLRGLNPGRDNTGRLFYLYLASKKRDIADRIGEDYISGNAATVPGMMIKLASAGRGREAAALLAGLPEITGRYPAIAAECLLLAAEKGTMNCMAQLEAYAAGNPSMRAFAKYAARKINPSYSVKYDMQDRVITENPYWKKYANNPVMPSVPGTYKSWHTANPDILVNNGTIYFYYRAGDGHDRMALATAGLEGFDGTIFGDYPKNPVIDIGRDSFDDLAVLDPAAMYFSKKVFLYYSGLGKGDDSIGLAISEDFCNFRKYRKNPVLTGRAPEVVVRDGLIYLYYVLPK